MKHQLRCQQLFQRGPLSFHVLHHTVGVGQRLFFLYRLGLGSFFGMAWDTSSTRYLKNVCLHFFGWANCYGSTNRGNYRFLFLCKWCWMVNQNTSYGSEEPSLPTSQPPISSQHTNLPALLVSCQPALLNLSHSQGTSKANYLFGSCYRIQIIIIFPDILVSSEEYSMTYLQFFK